MIAMNIVTVKFTSEWRYREEGGGERGKERKRERGEIYSVLLRVAMAIYTCG